ncbi:NAD(P)-dependent alcohol dehydrogenase [Lactonifactor longoviformis]|uniref:NAD(P)-dependent alcohol dehydrogenase n=1 Tax=Lactonifactor TaxID=420345 RepID=UPI0012B03627|nr:MULTISPECIES: NAD(P)-dependent alcohol dehydrogenase [Lactonifactor]MCB5713438.1 NAD(P)-dependent alcohol dehydrogenase [Lactonifactor longoviformis]MCB5716740.1 NAD(P)-dependent alcohol dehydrogenase [Lactonifactor longoviformis]MCQ4672363.1 NAD(P)-dependent alcohol dehydrogenase [Lactonifactor longoviformis]MSA01410.1 alcohol dehydrogenase catalytic domain-containing protein [Lactonifactor sp. BIOML-A5]MSA10708.1 alcohol dehydrogenase catalytic domain-containing protein [Lactonifactor sp.
MKVSVLTDIKKVEEQERDIPVIRRDEVLIKVLHCGVCGSDVHYYEHGRIGDFVVEKPMILGHECGGEVVEVGDGVKGLEKGDLVAVEPGYPCGKCEFCKTGRYHLCPDVVFLATPPYDGAFAEYIRYPADMVYRLPDTMDTIEGALIEPLCVGLHAAEQSEGKVGQTAAILGSGCIGLCTLMALKAMGICSVYVVDVIEKRLQMAKELGASAVIHGREQNAEEAIMELTRGKGVDLVFETAGTEFTTKQTAKLVKRGGTVVLVGMAANPVFPYDFGTLMSKEAKLHTVFRYKNLYPTAIELVSSGIIPVKKIVTDTYEFSRIGDALEDSIHRKEEMVKAVIRM